MPTRLRLLLVVLLLIGLRAPGVQAQPAFSTPEALADYISEALAGEAVNNAHWGVLVRDLETGAVFYARNAGKSFVPASNAKLYTIAAALVLLGPDYQYETRLYADGPIEDGVLKGNLIVRGAGDPTLGGEAQEDHPTAVFERWANVLSAQGISYVAGDLIGDDDVFDDTPLGTGWAWDDQPYYYSAEIGGLVFNENTIEVEIIAQAPGEPAAVRWAPYNTDYVEIINSTRTTPAGTELDEEYERRRGTNIIRLASRVPAGRIDREALTIANPTRYFVHVLREALVLNGVGVAGRGVDVDVLSTEPDYDAEGVRPVARYVSPPMAEIAEVIAKESNNLYAEQVLRTLGAELPVEDEDDLEPGSAAMGVAGARPFFAEAGVDTSRLTLVDGSGLSRMNLVTPNGTVALLRTMRQHPDEAVRRAFLEALPIGGVDGTLDYRFRRGPARANVRAKTGTLTGVSALSGYLTTAAGTPLAFSILCNNHTTRSSRIRAVQDRIVRALAAYRR